MATACFDRKSGLYRRSQKAIELRDETPKSSFLSNRHLQAASDEIDDENFLEALYPKDLDFHSLHWAQTTRETESRLTKTSICQPVMLGLTLALSKVFELHGLRSCRSPPSYGAHAQLGSSLSTKATTRPALSSR